MTRMGHDSPAAALIYQHATREADAAIAIAMNDRLSVYLNREGQCRGQSLWPACGPRCPAVTPEQLRTNNWNARIHFCCNAFRVLSG
jgi:hypothetical protein